MCGIAGLFHDDGAPIDESALRRMAAVIRHRGPDGEGVYRDEGSPGVGLAMRRLAVIDIVGGRQPMSTPDGRYTIVYNGEIYNAGELRAELVSHGHLFTGHCDTEVVLHGYAQWGPEVLDHLNGMWGFAVWDRRDRRLFLARDRLGIKPLVYARTELGLVFASEIKALFASGQVARTLDPSVLPAYLFGFVVPEPYSLIAGVRRLPAGHYLTADGNGVREVRYWDCNQPEDDKDLGFRAYEEAVHELLDDAVRRQLVSDVPLGSFLSGGIDSALVTTVMARHMPEPVRTFTIGFDRAAHDERSQARELSTALGTRHRDEVVSSKEVAAALPDLLGGHDEPGQSLIQSFFVSRFARQEVTVALSGIGGDELFSSYPSHVLVNLMARFDEVPGPLRSLALLLASVAPWSRGRRVAAVARLDPDQRAVRFLRLDDAPRRHQLLAPDLREAVDLDLPIHLLSDHFARSRAAHPLNRLLYVYIKTYLSDELLRAMDTMSMLNSLEVRVPMLDHRFVELAMRVPAQHKMRLKTGKLLLRSMASKLLPPSTIDQPKRGFNVPMDVWLRGELLESLRDVLSYSALQRRGVFDPASATALVERYIGGDVSAAQLVMMMFVFETWAQRALDMPQAASV